MNIDELIKLGENGETGKLQKYYEEEAERIIANARPENVLKLRALKARVDSQMDKIHDPLARRAKANEIMMESFQELNASLAPFRKE